MRSDLRASWTPTDLQASAPSLRSEALLLWPQEGDQDRTPAPGSGLGRPRLANRQGCSTGHLGLLRVTLHFVRPKKHFKKGKLRADAPKYVLKTPDVDNLAKFVLDAVQKRVLIDDKIVTTLAVHKRWCENKDSQRTVVELRVLSQ